MSWGINLEGFTLMAVCQSNQRASERTTDGGKTYGLHTYEALRYLNQIWPRVVTHRTIRDQIASQMQSQTPLIYGQDRLAFHSLNTKNSHGLAIQSIHDARDPSRSSPVSTDSPHIEQTPGFQPFLTKKPPIDDVSLRFLGLASLSAVGSSKS